ncbi:glycerol-3-phosphate acyltransferase 2, mitochondrial-like [Protopterus annectens]|uniref:glycerol-3-phosphate acyltransferase 2, mitochondrial-like n=1 Tax=Protopterus annectens TaxID=7888 RepID=UPI001CF9F967|nr:glycerol-3-phosphate acyltransferase 2, mitochondrial-like [Protopterus annectens]
MQIAVGIAERCCVSFWAVCCTLFEIFRHDLGCVRLDFGQPFSLKEYAKNKKFCLQHGGRPVEELLLPAVLGKRSEIVDCEKTPWWIQNCVSNLDAPDEDRCLVGSLSQHILTTAVSCCAIMPTALLSCLLLYRHKQGVFLPRLMKDFSWLLEEVLFRNFDVGFSGRLQDIVLHTLSLLRDCVMLCCASPNDLFVFPKNSREAMIDLALYSRPVLSVFICEAVGACAVNSVLMEMKDCAMNPEFDFDVVISEEELNRKIFQLFHLLPYDILLLTPCHISYCFCWDAVDKLVQVGILTMEEFDHARHACDTKRTRISEELLWKPTDDFMDSDSDYDDDLHKRLFKLSSSSSSPDYYYFLCSLLRPVLKAYAEAATFLLDFNGPVKELAYIEDLYQYLLRKTSETAFYECATRTLATSAVQTFKELGVFQECASSVFQLSSTFDSIENRRKLHHFIQQFII